jgi:hypothetical protein
MRRLGFIFTLLCLLLAACAAPPADIPSASPTATKRTATPSATLTPALDLTPETPTPDIPTITPLPTIPTFTPTFDARTIVTATPAPRAECPAINRNLIPDINVLFEQDSSLTVLKTEKVLGFLNAAGAPKAIITTFSQELKWFDQGDGIQQDITNDGVDELLLSDFHNVYVFACQGGKYYDFLGFGFDPAWIRKIHFKTPIDMNADGIPELPVIAYGGANSQISVSIYEFDGHGSLKPVLYETENGFDFPSTATFFVKEVSVVDVDKNGISELVLTGGIPPVDAFGSIYPIGFPWREEKRTYKWNGNLFVSDGPQYASPQYPFQFIQDADGFVLKHEYANAMSYYQEVTTSQNLDWWSEERHEWYLSKNYGNDPTPLPTTPSTAGDYPQIAAYAYYRMVVLHTLLGETEAARVKYATLQEKFPAGSPGHPYAEMATGFWDAWQSSGRMYDACAAAIAYADAQPEILVPLGSDYHGWQSHHYQPADVCPFR